MTELIVFHLLYRLREDDIIPFLCGDKLWRWELSYSLP